MNPACPSGKCWTFQSVRCASLTAPISVSPVCCNRRSFGGGRGGSLFNFSASQWDSHLFWIWWLLLILLWLPAGWAPLLRGGFAAVPQPPSPKTSSRGPGKSQRVITLRHNFVERQFPRLAPESAKCLEANSGALTGWNTEGQWGQNQDGRK